MAFDSLNEQLEEIVKEIDDGECTEDKLLLAGDIKVLLDVSLKVIKQVMPIT